MTAKRRAVIDIGSNSIRLVVYGGSLRAPVPIYNERSRVSLGTCLVDDGIIDEDTMESALASVGRFHRLSQMMQVSSLRIVATAATREAQNGAEFVARAAERGIVIEVIDGETEAVASGMGIISEHPDADGYVGDLGGGSLELVRISKGKIGTRISVPLGTLRHDQLRGLSPKQAAQLVRAEMDRADSAFVIEPGLPFYMIGGSWRSLARLHMHVTAFPLAVLANYAMPPAAPAELLPLARDSQAVTLTKVVPSARIASLPGAATLLSGLVRLFAPAMLITSISGIREGLLFDAIPKAKRREDPLVAAARWEGRMHARFPYHGDALADWIADIFSDDPAAWHRLRHSACLLADTVWNVSPEYRSRHSLSLALDGSWPSVTPNERAIIAAALLTAQGAKGNFPEILLKLADPADLAKAARWGMAIRLAMRLDGGSGAALQESTLSTDGTHLLLELAPEAAVLRSGSVERRLTRLATALGLTAVTHAS